MKSEKKLFTEEDLRQAIKMARETEYPLAKGMDEIIETIKKTGEAEKNSMYDPDWEQKFLLKQLAIKLKKEQMSKQKFKTELRKSVNSEIGDYCYLSKEDDFIEVTEWVNGDGVDVYLSSSGEQRIAITWGQFKLLKKLVKQLENDDTEYIVKDTEIKNNKTI